MSRNPGFLCDDLVLDSGFSIGQCLLAVGLVLTLLLGVGLILDVVACCGFSIGHCCL